MDLSEQLALLKISAGYFTVAKEARVDLDSSLILSASKHKISRVPVVAENIDDRYTLNNCSWIDRQDPTGAIKQLSTLDGSEHSRLLLLLGAYYAFQPGNSKIYVDSAVVFLNLARSESIRLHIRRYEMQCDCLLGKCYLKKGQVPEAMIYFKKVTDDPYLSDDRVKAKAWNYLGTYCQFIPSTILMRINSLKKALKLFVTLNDHANEANTLMDLAYLNFAAVNVPQAEFFAKASLDIQKKVGFRYTHYTTDLLALISYTHGDFVTQLKFALLSVRTATLTLDSLGLAMFYERVGDSFTGSSKTKNESIFWYKKAFQEFKRNGGDTQMYRLLGFLTSERYGIADSRSLIIFIRQVIKKYPPENTIDQQDAYQILANCYSRLGDQRQAENYFLLAENLNHKNRKIRGDLKNAELYYNIGDFFFNRGQFYRSRSYLLRFTTDPASRINSPQNLLNAYWELHTIDSNLKDSKAAVLNLEKFTALHDSLFNKSIVDGSDSTVVKITPADFLNTNTGSDNEHVAAPGLLKEIILPSLIAIFLIIIMCYIIYSDIKDGRRLKQQLEEVTKKDEQLQLILNENEKIERSKEWVFNEIQQRVMENLQIAIQLLSAQSAHLTDIFANEAIKQSQSRMQAMLLIHRNLYQENDRSLIEMSDYITKMSSYLHDYFTSPGMVSFDLQLEFFSLSLNQAVPVGLILNEAISNSLKHAFKPGQNGVIKILTKFTDIDNKVICLSIIDNGVGLKAGFDLDKIDTLGILLITGLGSQLDAKVKFLNTPGLAVTLEFKVE